jgi:hypothetical protein
MQDAASPCATTARRRTLSKDRHANDGRCAHPGLDLVITTLLWATLTNRFVWVVLLVTAGFGARSAGRDD